MAYPDRRRKPVLRVTLPHNDHERAPTPSPLDPALSAIIDHLLMIEAHLEALDDRFTAVQALVEELIP